MALKIKPKDDSAKHDAQADAKPAEPATEAQQLQGQAQLDLLTPTQGGAATVTFRRITLDDLEAIFAASTTTGQLGVFIERCSQPKLERSDIEALDADDADAMLDIMNHLMQGVGGTEDGEDEGGVFDDASPIKAGKWDGDARRYTLMRPLRVTSREQTSSQAQRESVMEITSIRFDRKATFREAAPFQNETAAIPKLRLFLRIYGTSEPIPVPLMPGLIGEMDAQDAMTLIATVMPEVAEKKRRWRLL